MGDKAPTFDMFPKALNGAIAGMIGATATYPLDLVKVRLQNQPIGPKGERMYYSMLDCFQKTYKAEGTLGMFRGSLSTLVLVGPEKGVKLAFNDLFRHILKPSDGSFPLPLQMLAGGMAGMCQSLVTTPRELMKVQLQDAGRVAIEAQKEGRIVKRQYAVTIAYKLIKTYGPLGMWKGIGPTMTRDGLFSVVFFPTFFHVNDMGPRRPNRPHESRAYWSFLSGIIAGAIAAFCLTPVDVVKTRVQAREDHSVKINIPKLIFSILKNEGPFAFYKGGACRIMVIAPLFGITQMVYYFGIAEWFLGIERV